MKFEEASHVGMALPPPFIVSLRGAAADAVAAAAIACGWLPDTAPDIFDLDDGATPWIERFAATTLGAYVVWGSATSRGLR